MASPAAAGQPPILLREGWQARPPSASMKKQNPVAILVHHTGAPQKPATPLASKLRNLQRFSQAREKLADGRMKPAWPDVPYHYYIAADGKIGEGRAVTAVGDTNTAYNPTGFIQVVVEGNFESEHLTDAQTASLTNLLQWLKTTYSIPSTAILAHQDKAQTECPGTHLLQRLPGIIAGLK
jgi:N-acetyl-anhydromuramyl-L-alanine amidase AmpD